MQILLTHALRSEAGSIRQHYPLAKLISRGNGQELIQLNRTMHILRTGVGLESSETALNAYINPEKFDLIVHFGVSGSLSDNLPPLQIIKGTNFSCAGRPDLKIVSPELLGSSSLPEAPFYSSAKAITDEVMRESAASSGAQAVDMESYSVAVFCKNHSLPLVAIRCISDRAGRSTPEEFKRYYPRASQTLQDFLLKKILVDLS